MLRSSSALSQPTGLHPSEAAGMGQIRGHVLRPQERREEDDGRGGVQEDP